MKYLLVKLVCLWSHIYTYGRSQWLNKKINQLYTIWIRNFIGEVSEMSYFRYPVRLQGGGQKRIRIGSRTSILANSILGCWVRYEKGEHCELEIIIGNDCSIGEYCHITAIKKITIGDGLLTGGRYS